MKYDTILEGITKHISLNKEERMIFISVLYRVEIANGEFLEKQGKQTEYFMHVESGCLMTYHTDKSGSDHVMQFATSGWWTGDLQSFNRGVPSENSTRALATSSVLLISLKDMAYLLEKVPKFERYFRIIYQNSLITHQQRIIQNFSATAEERYLVFQTKYSTLEQYLPLKYIASYLGITPEFLSKIRRRLAKG